MTIEDVCIGMQKDQESMKHHLFCLDATLTDAIILWLQSNEHEMSRSDVDERAKEERLVYKKRFVDTFLNVIREEYRQYSNSVSNDEHILTVSV
jgi:hypothetical protein